MPRWLLALLLVGCSSPVMDPDLPLADRFEIVAFRLAEPPVADELWRWPEPTLAVEYRGPERFREHLAAHLAELADTTGLRMTLDADVPDLRTNMVVVVGPRIDRFICSGDYSGWENGEPAVAHIRADLPDWHIRQCIVQETTQLLGLTGDLDGPIVSRQDTVFASYGGAGRLTAADKAVLRVFFDRRLSSGMTRAEAMPIVRQIAAELEAQQAENR